MRMMLLGAVALLTACSSPLPTPETGLERWYAVKAGYSVAMQAAAEYKQDCQRKPVEIQARCMAIVENLREIDTEAQFYETIGDTSFVDNDDKLLAEATEQMELLRAKLETEMLSRLEE